MSATAFYVPTALPLREGLPEPNLERYNRANRAWETVKVAGGKETYQHKELREAALQHGLYRIEYIPLLIDPERRAAAFISRGYFLDGCIFEGVGDADQVNCNAGIGDHYIRMAATRADVRMFGNALNADANAADEFGGGTEGDGSRRQTQTQTRQSSGGNLGGGATTTTTTKTLAAATGSGDWQPPAKNSASPSGYECEECAAPLVDGKYKAVTSASSSLRETGAILCWEHRQARKQRQAAGDDL